MKHIFIVDECERPIMAFDNYADACEFAQTLYPEATCPDHHITRLAHMQNPDGYDPTEAEAGTNG